MRLFVALPVPEQIARECARVGALFPSDAVKRVSPELMHVTLAFIGWAPDAAAATAATALRGAFGGVAPIACRLGAIGAFPTRTRPRVAWVGLDEGADGVLAAARAARDALRSGGIPFDDKPPVAHLTIARVRDDAPAAARQAVVAALGSARVGPLRFEIDEAVLFESRLARSGPTYLALERVPLAKRLPSAPPGR